MNDRRSEYDIMQEKQAVRDRIAAQEEAASERWRQHLRDMDAESARQRRENAERDVRRKAQASSGGSSSYGSSGPSSSGSLNNSGSDEGAAAMAAVMGATIMGIGAIFAGTVAVAAYLPYRAIKSTLDWKNGEKTQNKIYAGLIVAGTYAAVGGVVVHDYNQKQRLTELYPALSMVTYETRNEWYKTKYFGMGPDAEKAVAKAQEYCSGFYTCGPTANIPAMTPGCIVAWKDHRGGMSKHAILTKKPGESLSSLVIKTQTGNTVLPALVYECNNPDVKGYAKEKLDELMREFGFEDNSSAPAPWYKSGDMDPDKLYIVTQGGVDLLQGPHPQQEVFGTILEGSCMMGHTEEAQKKQRSNGYIRLVGYDAAGKKIVAGYVLESKISPAPDTMTEERCTVVSGGHTIPVPTPAPAQASTTPPAGIKHSFYTVTASALNIRSAPHAGGAVMASAAQGSCVMGAPDGTLRNGFEQVSARDRDGDVATGYMSADYLRLATQGFTESTCRAALN